MPGLGRGLKPGDGLKDGSRTNNSLNMFPVTSLTVSPLHMPASTKMEVPWATRTRFT